MKKYLFYIASIAIIGLQSCKINKGTGTQDDTENQFTIGAYADFRSITDEEMKIFESTYKHNSSLTPQSVATQVVAGINYKFLCTNDANHIIKKDGTVHEDLKIISLEPSKQ